MKNNCILFGIICGLSFNSIAVAETCDQLAKDLKEIGGFAKGAVLTDGTKTERYSQKELKEKLQPVLQSFEIGGAPKRISTLIRTTTSKVAEDYAAALRSLDEANSNKLDRLARAKIFFLDEFRGQQMKKTKTMSFCKDAYNCNWVTINHPELIEKARRLNPNALNAIQFFDDVGPRIKLNQSENLDQPKAKKPEEDTFLLRDIEASELELKSLVDGAEGMIDENRPQKFYEATYDVTGLQQMVGDEPAERKKILDELSLTYSKLMAARSKLESNQGMYPYGTGIYGYKFGNTKKGRKPPAAKLDSSEPEDMSALEKKLEDLFESLAETLKPQKIVRIATLSTTDGLEKIVGTFDTSERFEISCNNKHEVSAVDGVFCIGKPQDFTELQKSLCDRLSPHLSFQKMKQFKVVPMKKERGRI